MRVFDKIEDRSLPTNTTMREFVLDRDRYVAGEKFTWHVLGAEDREPATFQSHGIDPYEYLDRHQGQPDHPPQVVLQSCFGCHRDAGAASMLSYTRLFVAKPAGGPNLEPLSLDREVAITGHWKGEHASWGVLRGHWEASR